MPTQAVTSSGNLNGTTLTLVEEIFLGDTKLKEIISKYVIDQIGNEARALKISQGGYYAV
jgi:hypothetical protein